VSGHLLSQTFNLASRSVLRTLRQPAVVGPSMIFPLTLLAVNSGGLQAATRLPGFPTDSFLDFAIAIAFMQGALFSAITAGTDLARDIETGFFSRLSLTPMRGTALLVGQLGGAMGLGLLQAVVFLVVGSLAGATMKTGPLGVIVLFALVVLISLGFGGVGAFFALRTGSAEAVQGMFPLLFVALFLSSMNLPRDLIEADWFRAVATYNPVSYLIEGIRSFFISGWDARALALGFGLAAAISVVTLTASVSALRERLGRT
jgi:ABC-2 type transport system permease protein